MFEWYHSYALKALVACVAVFSVSFQASGSRARARGQGNKKLVAKGRGREGKDTFLPIPSPCSSFCSRPLCLCNFPLALAFSRQEETEKTATQAKALVMRGTCM